MYDGALVPRAADRLLECGGGSLGRDSLDRLDDACRLSRIQCA